MSKKKLLALVLALVMLLGLLPVTAAAEGDVSERTVPNDNMKSEDTRMRMMIWFSSA